MPVRKCAGGHKYGSGGKCYKGSGSKTKAGKQGKAIKASQARQRKGRAY